MKNVFFFTIYILFLAILSALIFSILYMQFEEQPMLALNKAIKYGTILLAILFIIPAMKYKKIYAKEKLGFLCPKKVFLKNVFKGFLVSIVLSLPLLFFMNFLEIRNFNFIQITIDSYFFISLLKIIFSIRELSNSAIFSSYIDSSIK